MLETIVTAAITALATSAGAFFLARHRLRREFQLQYRAETVARKILSHPIWEWRTFKVIRHHLKGFEDDELRKILIQAGAVRFETDEGEEIWGLYENVKAHLELKHYPSIPKAYTQVDEVILHPDVEEEIRGLVRDGSEDEAIKRVRAVTRLALPEALELLRRFKNESGSSSRGQDGSTAHP